LQGTAGKRVQLVTEDQFRIISNGQVLANDYLKYGPVSEHLNQINLLPGESSFGVLVFAVNKDDNRPVLRYTDAVKSYFFDLTASAPAAEPLQVTPLQFGADDLGKVNNPVPLGKTVAYTLNGDTLLLTVKQVEQGMDVSRRLWDIGGVKTLPGTGQDFIMPYLEITAAQSSAEQVGLKTSLFTVVSKGATLAKGAISCPYPCLADISMYPGGEAQGWLPRVKPQDDPAPLLNFNNDLYFSLTATSAGQTAAGAVTAPPTFSPNAIGYNTIKNVGESAEMEQHAVVQALAFSPDNKLLASGGDDHKIHIWNAVTGAEITVLAKHKAAIKYLAFSADGKLLASVGYNEEVIVWNVSDWSILQQLKQAGNGIFGQFLPDNNLVTVNQAGAITVWNVTTGEVVKQYFTQKNTSPKCQGSALYNFDMSPDGKVFAASLTCGYGVVWDPATGDRLATDYNHAIDSKKIPIVSAISVSNSSGLAAYAGSYYRHSGYLVDVLDTRNNLILGGIGTATTNVPAIAFAPNAEIIAAAIGNLVRTWWPNGFVWTGKHLIDLQAHTSQVTSIEFSLDGTLLASGDYSGKIAIWKVTK
jgi:WD40 repeat protein